MPEPLDYIREGAEIYRRSFATIRAEANLTRFKGLEEKVAVRIIHACGMVEIADDIDMSADFAEKARSALLAGAPILCDSKMVAQGITRSRLPADNMVICTLDDPRTPDLARAAGNTRSAAAMALWEPHLAGSLVAIGNAPTSLFRLLEMIAARSASARSRDRNACRFRRRSGIESVACRGWARSVSYRART